MKINSKDVVVYSVKVYKNVTFVVAFNTEKDKYAHFEISGRYNESDKIVRLFRSKLYFFVGYGNKHYDNIFINFLLKRRDHLHKYGYSFINKTFYEQFFLDGIKKHVWDDQLLDLKYAQNFDYIDMQMVLSQKSTRHTIYEECFRNNVLTYIDKEDDEYLSYDEFDDEYNKLDNKCKVIYSLFSRNYEKIELRVGILSKYNVDVIDNNDSSVLNTVLLERYQHLNNVKFGDLIPKNEEIYSTPIRNIVSNDIRFNTKEFSDFFDQTKSMLYSSLNNKNIRRFLTFGNSDILFSFNGIECENNSNVFKSENSGRIYILHIESLEANTCLRYGIFPSKLTESFQNVSLFRKMFDEFLTCAVQSPEKSNSKNMYTEGLENIVARYNSKVSWLYDPSKYAKAKVNSSLIMMMLIEQLLLNGAKLILIEDNTIVFKTVIELKDVIEQWKTKFGFSYTYTECKKFYKYSVYDYFALTTDNRLVSKGIFESRQINTTYPFITIKAVRNNLLYNVDIAETIRNTGNINDFLLFNKVSYPQRFLYKGIPIGNEVIYFITNTPLPNLYVEEPITQDKKYSKMDCLIKGVHVSLIEKYMLENSNVKFNIDYDFYINKAQSLINEIKTEQKIIEMPENEETSDYTENNKD